MKTKISKDGNLMVKANDKKTVSLSPTSRIPDINGSDYLPCKHPSKNSQTFRETASSCVR